MVIGDPTQFTLWFGTSHAFHAHYRFISPAYSLFFSNIFAVYMSYYPSHALQSTKPHSNRCFQFFALVTLKVTQWPSDPRKYRSFGKINMQMYLVNTLHLRTQNFDQPWTHWHGNWRSHSFYFTISPWEVNHWLGISKHVITFYVKSCFCKCLYIPTSVMERSIQVQNSPLELFNGI